jgi:hypothetical protein
MSIDKNKQYKTRDGQEVRIYATDGTGERCVHGSVFLDCGWVAGVWTADGFHRPSKTQDAFDLIEIKPRIKFERWALVERDGNYSLWLDKPSTASSVDAFAIKHIVFEVEEGEGLEHGSN